MSQPGKTQEELSSRPLMRILGDFGNSQIRDASSTNPIICPLCAGIMISLPQSTVHAGSQSLGIKSDRFS
jgi:hypothetical protein